MATTHSAISSRALASGAGPALNSEGELLDESEVAARKAVAASVLQLIAVGSMS